MNLSRVLNVTATDGQHFSDVTPVEIKMTAAGNGRSRFVYSGERDFFKCEDTDVAARLTETMAKAERNNYVDDEDDAFATVRRSPYGSNIHRPEFDRDRTPGEIHVSETQPPGTKLMKVGHSLISLPFFEESPSTPWATPSGSGGTPSGCSLCHS